MNRRVVFMAAAVVFLGGLLPGRAAWKAEVDTLEGSGITAELTSPYDYSPPTGSLPVWVTIHNASGSAHTWTIGTEPGPSYGGSPNTHIITETLRVENGQTARVALLVPLDALPAAYYYRNQMFRVDGYGVSERRFALPETNTQAKGDPTPSIGMSEDLATPIWTGLAKWYSDQSKDLVGSPMDLELLLGDWRGLAGFDTLWLSDASFAKLDAVRRGAVRDWIDHGGLLCLCVQTPDPSLRPALGLPPEGDAADVGLGRVRLVPWDGKPLPSETIADKANQPRFTRAADTVTSAADWPITRHVGTIPVNATFLIGFIVVFAVLVGPINLFVFARSAQRHRLFWTTPAISVGASVLLMAFIILQDGFGGHGERALFCLLVPDQKKTVVVQEQVVRTGVVLAHGFDVGEDLLLSPLKIADGPSRVYEQTSRAFSGDWFPSRSVQAQRADAVVPSRAEITLTNPDAARDGAPPVLTSSVPAALRTVLYRDPAGLLWTSVGTLRTGERITLHPGESLEVSTFFAGGSDWLDKEVRRLLDQRGGFVALADDGPFFETLPAIRWTKQRAVFAGPVTGAR